MNGYAGKLLRCAVLGISPYLDMLSQLLRSVRLALYPARSLISHQAIKKGCQSILF